MADQHTHPKVNAALRKLEASLQSDLLEREAITRVPTVAREHLARERLARERLAREHPARERLARERLARDCSARERSARELLGRDYRRIRLMHWWFRLRKVAYLTGAFAAAVLIAMTMLWWRLGRGPIEFDVATPWLTAAIAENFGSEHRVEVGGTQIERDSNGRTALRIRDIVVRDLDGAIVASAPKAEVGVSSMGLFTGRVRAERLSLVGAEMQVRIEPDSRVTVFAGSNKRPFVTASAAQLPVRAGMEPSSAGRTAAAAPPVPAVHVPLPDFGALLAWIDSLGATGLDGHDLSELGLKSGNLTVDDRRNGKQWTFHDINLSLTRPRSGSVALTVSSDDPERPWLLGAALTAGERGYRTVDIETQRLPAKDLMLAMRLGDGQYEPDMPISARVRATIGPDGIPQMVDGRILLDKGSIVDVDEPLSRIAIDRAEFSLEWDAARQALMVPFQIVAGGNRITLFAQVDAPHDNNTSWGMKMTGGTVVLAGADDSNPLILNRFLLRLRIDPDKQRIDLEQGEFGNLDLGLLASGNIDLSNGDPRLALQLAGSRMSFSAMMRLWPVFVTPKVRDWVERHISGGTVDRVVIATNAPLSTLRAGGPPVPDDGLAIEITGTGAVIAPVEGLPPIRDADMSLRIAGRTATVNVGGGNIEIAPNRKLALTNGVFEVPDTEGKAPPARVRFRIDGPVPAAAELLASDRLREYSGAPVEPNTSRGTLSAQVVLDMPLRPDLPPGATQYSINMDVANFAADRLVMGQKVEANNLRVTANNQGYQIKGDVKINGVAAALDFRKPRGDADADIRVAATLDEAARNKLGFDVGSAVTGPVPVKISGRIPATDGESRCAVEADLTQARIDRLLPGWTKPPGKSARATFTLVSRPQGTGTRVDDLAIESSSSSVKGSIELNDTGDIVSANLPVFNLSDGDKALLKAERGPDGALRVMVRGEVYDGRGFVKSMLTGSAAKEGKQNIKDIDIDVRLGTVAGFHGETLRGLDIRMSRRAGAIKSFTMSGKLGRDTALTGDLRGRTGGRNVIYVETPDAGAFFRFADIYPKVFGGQMWMAMDPPGPDPQAVQEGILNIRNFAVRGEAALERVAAGSNTPANGHVNQGPGVEFSRMRVEFTRTLGKIAIREGIVKGPLIGATTEGYIDYQNDDVHMRGTFVPFYGLNNMFGQIPIVGLVLGNGSNEGLVGLTYEVAGSPAAPVLRVNPISVVVPGLFRKIFEFPSSGRTQSYADPNAR